MAAVRDKNHQQLEIYARRYFDLSPTWFAWNKLLARDVHDLNETKGFEGQNVLFYLNHPIQFISLTGLAIQIELGGGDSGSRLCFIVLDDGSGMLMNVKVRRRTEHELAKAEYPSNTLVDNLDVYTSLGLPIVKIDNKAIHVGQPIRVRGTIETYRGIRQLDLKRIKLLKSTNEEVENWKEIVKWKKDVLDKPWILTKEQQKQLDDDNQAKQLAHSEHQEKKRAWHARRAEKEKKSNAKREAKRLVLEAHYDDGALPGSEVIKAPWE